VSSTSRRADVLTGIAVGVVALAFYLALIARIDERLLEWSTVDVWFQADIARVYENMTERWSNHHRTQRHPLFSLVAYTPTFVLRTIGLAPERAALVVVAVLGSLSSVGLFTAFRFVGLKRLDALVFSALAALSASSIFWYTVPETFPFGGTTIVMAIALVAAGTERARSTVWDVIVSAATLSATVTNWAVGLIATVLRRAPKLAFRVTTYAFALVTVLWSLQVDLFPSARWFLLRRGEPGSIFAAEAMGPVGVLRAFFAHSAVLPAIDVVDYPNAGAWPLMLVQAAEIGSNGLLALITTLAWFALLGLGLFAVVTEARLRRFGVFLVLAIGSQVALHLVFGNETFLYSAHFLPLLVALAALGAMTRLRSVAVTLAALVSAGCGVVNLSQFNRAADFLDTHRAYEHDIIAEIQRRPADPWPRGTPRMFTQTALLDGAWHERGASLYPVSGTFGVEIWVRDTLDVRVATSTSIADADISEEAASARDTGRPVSIATTTPYYEALWENVGTRTFDLTLSPSDIEHRLEIVVRGIAPSDPGPLRSIEVGDQGLLLNARWELTVDPPVSTVYGGREGPTGWSGSREQHTVWEREDGWLFARIPLEGAGPWSIRVADTRAGDPVTRIIDRIR
jgi:hypothetical protein